MTDHNARPETNPAIDVTQRQVDIRRRRLTALFVSIGVILVLYGMAAGNGWSISGLQPPMVDGTRIDKRHARAARTLAESSVAMTTPSQAAIGTGRIARSGKPLFCGGTKPYVALTFDDGPTPNTQKLVKLLKQSGVSATFFVLGSKLDKDRSSVQAMKSVGEIANHSWSHAAFTTLNSKEIKSEVDRTQSLIRLLQGSAPMLMRPPYGARDEKVNKSLAKLKMAEALWSADTEDALNAPWQTVADYAVQGIGPGAIVLMHDGQDATLTALRKKILLAARRRKLQFVTLSELLAVNPPSQAQLDAGPKGCAQAGTRNVSGLFFKPSEQLGYQP